jgi:hypothetical protein
MKLLLLITENENNPIPEIITDNINRINYKALNCNDTINNIDTIITSLNIRIDYNLRITKTDNNEYTIYNYNEVIGYIYIVEYIK